MSYRQRCSWEREENQQAVTQHRQRGLLEQRFNELKAKTQHLWDEHLAECDRGGCGPLAAEIEANAKASEEEATQIFGTLTQDYQTRTSSSFIARTVQAFEALGLFGPAQLILLPLAYRLNLGISGAVWTRLYFCTDKQLFLIATRPN